MGPRYPPLKRWAIVGRPDGTCWDYFVLVGISKAPYLFQSRMEYAATEYKRYAYFAGELDVLSHNRAIEIGGGAWVSWDPCCAEGQSIKSQGKSRLKGQLKFRDDFHLYEGTGT